MSKKFEDVHVFQICESDAVAAYFLEDAISFYKDLTGLNDEDLYDFDDIETVPFNAKVRKDEDTDELITVSEIVEMYWKGEPFVALSTGGY